MSHQGSSTLHTIAKRIIPILLTIAVPIAILTVIYLVWPKGLDRQTDPIILVSITAGYTYCVAVVLYFTRQWSLIGRGLLGTMVGDALFYGYLSGPLDGIGWLNTTWTLEVIRASFTYGVILLVWGVTIWVREQARQNDEDGAVMLTEKMP